jgi:hypothetical protein
MKIIVTSSVTLDGVAQAPGLPDEDPRDGFSPVRSWRRIRPQTEPNALPAPMPPW